MQSFPFFYGATPKKCKALKGSLAIKGLKQMNGKQIF